jgi:pimeloyl-ACP methyl ester carboxylesterase
MAGGPNFDSAGHSVGRGWSTAIVGGHPARYFDLGEGPVLLFLHGWGLSYTAYRPALARLAGNGFRVIAPALPGFGGTPALPDAEFSLRGYADWVAELLDVVGVATPVLVVGHSFGGGVAIRLAHDHPAMVDRLVLVNSIGGSVWARGSTVRAVADRPLWDWGLHVPADLLPHRQLTRVLPVIIEDLLPNVRRNGRAVWRAANLARRADLGPELAELRERGLPVVILWGQSDRLISDVTLESLRSALGDPELVTVPGAHNWLLAEPDRFCEVITNIAGAGRPGAGRGPASGALPVSGDSGSVGGAA